MATYTPAQKKLVNHLMKRNPDLSEKELGSLLGSIRRFVTVVQKIYTEPQAQIKIIDKKRIIDTDLEEFRKVLGNEKSISINKAFKDFNEEVTKDKYGR